MEDHSFISMKRALLVLNCIVLGIGNCAGPIIMRLYFIHGGKRIWFSAWLETAGWPFILLPLTAVYLHRHATKPSSETKFFTIKPPLFIASAIIGLITGADDYLYAYGIGKLPVSTSALIIATQLAFTAGFAFLLVKQKFTFYSTNAVVLLTVGAGILALHSSNDRPKGESSKEYVMGFMMTLGAAALYGFILPLMELTCSKAKQPITYSLVMEMQMVMSLFATIFCTVGMIINNDFQAIGREAREFELGETKYYVVVVISALIWQFFFMGAIGVIFCASSLLSGIIITALLPMVEVFGVIFFHESFKAEKGVSLALSLWGFVSYFYGEIKLNRKQVRQTLEVKVETPEIDVSKMSK